MIKNRLRQTSVECNVEPSKNSHCQPFSPYCYLSSPAPYIQNTAPENLLIPCQPPTTPKNPPIKSSTYIAAAVNKPTDNNCWFFIFAWYPNHSKDGNTTIVINNTRNINYPLVFIKSSRFFLNLLAFDSDIL